MMAAFRLVAVMAMLWAAPAAAEEPAAVVDGFHERLLAVMKAGPELGFQGRFDALAPTVAEAFDLAGMTRTAIGAGAANLSPDELARLTEAFGRYTVANYARQFSAWDGERFESGAPVPARGGGQLVPSRIIPATGAPTRLDYVMRERDGTWRIADVLLDGTISQVAVRRSEFQAVLKREGPGGLLQVLERRTAALAAG